MTRVNCQMKLTKPESYGPGRDNHVQIARKLRSVENGKIQLLEQLTAIFRSIQAGNERDMAESLGGLVGLSYYLARQLGLDLAKVDEQAQDAWIKTLRGQEEDTSDIEFVQEYLRSLR
jgi:MazG-like family